MSTLKSGDVPVKLSKYYIAFLFDMLELTRNVPRPIDVGNLCISIAKKITMPREELSDDSVCKRLLKNREHPRATPSEIE